MPILPQILVEDTMLAKEIFGFEKTYGISKLLKAANAYEENGFPVIKSFRNLLRVAMINNDYYQEGKYA